MKGIKDVSYPSLQDNIDMDYDINFQGQMKIVCAHEPLLKEKYST